LSDDAKFRTSRVEAAGRSKGVSTSLQSVAVIKYGIQTEFTMVNMNTGCPSEMTINSLL